MTPERKTPLDSDALAGESHKGADDAAALPVRLNRFSKAHHRALDMADYAADNGYVKESRLLNKCGDYLLFRDYYEVEKVRLHAADFCKKHLLCPLCAIRRGAKLVQSYLQRLEIVQGENPGLKAYLVTVTVKNGPDLAERFKHLKGSMRRLVQARRDHLKAPQKNRHVEAAKAVGVVGSYEFKRGSRSGEWHPHVHMVWLCHEAPDQSKLSEEWLHLTGDSYIVDVRPFHNQDDLVGGFLEVFKYAVKFSDLPLEDNLHGYEVLRGRNLVFSLGSFRGVEIPEELSDAPLDDEPFLELMFRFSRGVGYSLDKTHKQHKDIRTQKIPLCNDKNNFTLSNEKFLTPSVSGEIITLRNVKHGETENGKRDHGRSPKDSRSAQATARPTHYRESEDYCRASGTVPQAAKDGFFGVVAGGL